jgi:hypothetical protein
MKNLAASGHAREGGTLNLLISCEPAEIRIQDPRLKRATQAVTTEDDRVRPSMMGFALLYDRFTTVIIY